MSKDVYEIMKDMGVSHGPMPQNFLREGSPIPGGVAGYVLTILFQRMARRDFNQKYKGQIVPLKAGQVCCSIRDIANVTEFTKKRVETAIKNLQKLGILGTVKGTGLRHNLTVYNIHLEQFRYADPESKGTTKGTVRGQYGDSTGTEIDTANTANTASPSPKGGEPSAAPDERVLSMDGRLFAEGRRILGPKAGGVVTKLKKALGPGKTFELLTSAEGKADPMAYVSAALRDAPLPPEEVPSGGIIRNPRKDGRGSGIRSSVRRYETPEQEKVGVEARKREAEEYYAEIEALRQASR